MHIEIPDLALVAVIGSSDSYKQFFIKEKLYKEESTTLEKIKEDLNYYKKQDQVIILDMDTLDEQANTEVIQISKRQHRTPVAIVFYTRDLGGKTLTVDTIENGLMKKGFKQVYVLDSARSIKMLDVQRIRLSNNKRAIHGPFDIIGDVHGCYDELCELLEKLGYQVNKEACSAYSPEGRILVFCGDLVDRGPKVVEVLKLVMGMANCERAYSVLGNHDGKLQRKLRGANVQVIHGLEKTLAQLEEESETFKSALQTFLDGLVSHYVFDTGKLVVAHAGLKEKFQGRESKKIRDLAMFGETTGEVDAFGLPQRLDWSEDYKGDALVVYGHTPKKEAHMIHHTINIDTGCVYGGKLTAFRYPEQEIVDVEARATYYESKRPLL